jgi:peptidoglycan-associated lipoprotein
MSVCHRLFVAITTAFTVVLLSACAANQGPSGSRGQTPADQGGQGTQGGQFGAQTPGSPGSGQSVSGGAGPQAGQSEDGSGVVKRVIYFEFDSSKLKPEYRSIIEAHARYLQENPDIVSILEGHADEQGSREYNVALGNRRAETVRQLMSVYGITRQQLHTLSYGEERPAVAGSDEARYAQNRRVEIVY